MNAPVKQGCWALTEKEKQTLRLIVRGHDAKSIARSLDLSVHTINERLRDARRKMAVSSSREAARMLLDVEANGMVPGDPDLLGDVEIGEDPGGSDVDRGMAPIGARRAYRRSWVFIGVGLMLVLGLLALATLPQSAPVAPSAPAASVVAANPEVVDAAGRWLALLDDARWDESYRATGSSFRKLNTVRTWTAASEKVRASFGGMISRTFVSQEDMPAPPHGYEVVKFHTRFANKADAIETVTLDRESGLWRVVGIYVE